MIGTRGSSVDRAFLKQGANLAGKQIVVERDKVEVKFSHVAVVKHPAIGEHLLAEYGNVRNEKHLVPLLALSSGATFVVKGVRALLLLGAARTLALELVAADVTAPRGYPVRYLPNLSAGRLDDDTLDVFYY